jgi:polysaccharide pyruvyl transferase WcaK-like protein
MKSGSVKDGTSMDELLKGLARQLEEMLDREADLRIFAIPFFGRRDALVHKALVDRLPSSHRCRVEVRGAIADPCEYVNLARSARCVIGMRLHALILASLSGTPLVALAYSSKVSSFMKQISLDEQVIDIQSRPDVSTLTDRVNAALKCQYAPEKSVRVQVDALRQINREALDEIVRLIQTG